MESIITHKILLQVKIDEFIVQFVFQLHHSECIFVGLLRVIRRGMNLFEDILHMVDCLLLIPGAGNMFGGWDRSVKSFRRADQSKGTQN